MSESFDISQSPEVKKYLDTKFKKAAERAMLATANRIVNHIQTVIIPGFAQPPVDKGMYRAAWRAKKSPNGAEVYNNSPQASHIEYGVRAENVKIGRAMIDALTKWVLRKGIVTGKGKSAQADARGMAFAIANSMKKRGIFNRDGKRGLQVLKTALERTGDFVNEEFATEIKREFGEKG